MQTIRHINILVKREGAKAVIKADVTETEGLDTLFETIGSHWESLDFIVHAVAFSDKNELKGRYSDTSRDNFLNTMDISCYSFTNLAQRARPYLTKTGTLLSLSYLGSEKVLPN